MHLFLDDRCETQRMSDVASLVDDPHVSGLRSTGAVSDFDYVAMELGALLHISLIVYKRKNIMF